MNQLYEDLVKVIYEEDIHPPILRLSVEARDKLYGPYAASLIPLELQEAKKDV
jgi:hypothetical protein